MKKIVIKSGILFMLFFIVVFFISCDKNSDTYKKNAKIEWKGDYALDGCGFWVIINGKEYKPENESIIGNEFKTEKKTAVKLEYQLLNEKINSKCFTPTLTMAEGIKVISIKKK